MGSRKLSLGGKVLAYGLAAAAYVALRLFVPMDNILIRLSASFGAAFAGYVLGEFIAARLGLTADEDGLD